MKLFGEFLACFFTFIVILSHIISSVHGIPPYLLGDVAMNCGCLSNSTALDGRHWVGETPLLRPIGKSKTSTPVHKFVFADPTPYLTARISFSSFSYFLRVSPGQKFIRFHFYPESYLGFENSQDSFTVQANSFTLMQNFSASLAADALGVKYFLKEYCLNVNETGILQIFFFPSQKRKKVSSTFAFVNGIEIISMPTGLYYTPDDGLGPRIVGSNRFYYIENNTALELVKRLNVGGGTIQTVDDSGLFRSWTGDIDYLQVNHLVSVIEYTVSPPFLAPPKIYYTSRKVGNNLQLDDHFTWKIPVDTGFAYLLRLHFSYFGVEFPKRGIKDFNILIQNLVVEAQVNGIEFNGGNRIPIHRDYLVILKGDKDGSKCELLVSLHPFDGLVLGLFKGLEIFKLSNTHNSLVSSYSSGSMPTYSYWTSKIHIKPVDFGLSHAIITLLTILLALVNSGIYMLKQIYGYTFEQERNVVSGIDEPSCQQFSLTQILLATQHFNKALVIGKGGFGKVYKGFIYGRPEILAIKRLKPDSKQGAREFWIEIETLSKLRHVHLVSLLGYCMERGEMILVYEYMPRGTIADNLYKSGRDGNERIPLTWEQRLRICIGAARGLEYLHTGTQHGVIHRDVKDTNILLDENFVAKVSDFGLSKIGKIGETEGENSTKVKGTIGYIDPNYFMTRELSTKSDVYAFGMVLLVVLSGRPAVERRFFEEVKSLSDCYREYMIKGEMNKLIDPCLQQEILTESLTSFMEAVGSCLHRRPKKRPTMSQLVVHLEDALDKHLGFVPSEYGDNSVVSRNSIAHYNRSFESYKFQVAPVPDESIISLPMESNKANKEIQNGETSVKVDHKITQKPLLVRSWVSLINILKLSKTTVLDLSPALMFSEWNHPIRTFTLKNIKLATKGFSNKFLICVDLYYRMYKGFLNDVPGTVAIKRFYSTDFYAFQAEIGLISTISHVHLVPFVGLCRESKELIIVYEYMSHGTLSDHLYKYNKSRNDQTSLTWEQRLNICIGAASGLNYLHKAGFIHRDVNDRNIVFNEENLVAKISDFGECKRVNLEESEAHVITRVVGTYGFLDPSYGTSGILTKASDVYSFGIVLLVVLSGKPTTYYSRSEKHGSIKDWYETCSQEGNLDEFIDPKLVGLIPSASLERFVELIKICLLDHPKHRPVMAQVVENLEESLNLAQTTIRLFKSESDLTGLDNDQDIREAQSEVTPQALQRSYT